MRTPYAKPLNLIWVITEQEYGYNNQPVRKKEHANQRYTFWLVARKLLPSASHRVVGRFTGRKNGSTQPYDRSTVIHGIKEAKLNYERVDKESLDFVEATNIILSKCYELLGDPKSESKIKQRYRTGIENLNKSYKKLRVLESKLSKTDNDSEALQLKVMIDICKRKIESKTLNYKQRKQTTKQRLESIWNVTLNKFYHYPTSSSKREDVLFRMAFYYVAKMTIPLVTLDTLGEFTAKKLEVSQYNHSTVFHALEQSRNMFARRDDQSLNWCVKVRELVKICKENEHEKEKAMLANIPSYRQQISRNIQAHRGLNERHFINRQLLMK